MPAKETGLTTGDADARNNGQETAVSDQLRQSTARRNVTKLLPYSPQANGEEGIYDVKSGSLTAFKGLG
jgi:hypothetical protein